MARGKDPRGHSIRAAPESNFMRALLSLSPAAYDAARRGQRAVRGVVDAGPIGGALRLVGDPLQSLEGPARAVGPINALAKLVAPDAKALSSKMKQVNNYLAQRKSAFAAGLEPPPTRTTPVKKYATERAGRQVNVVGEEVLPPERITLEQARAAGVTGPVPYPAPAFRYKQTGPRVEVLGNAPRTLEKAAGGDNVVVKFNKSRIEQARKEVDMAPSVKWGFEPEWASEHYRFAKTGEPGSFVSNRTEFPKGRGASNEVLAYDDDGKLVGIFSQVTEGEGKGAFKIVVRDDATRQGWGARLLDEAEKKGLDVVGNISANSFTQSGRGLLRSWLDRKAR